MISVTATIDAYTMPDDRDLALTNLLGAMTLAKQTWAQRMYGFTHPEIAAGYLAMYQRGVNVRLLLDYSQSVDPPEVKLLHWLLSQGFPADHICITTSMLHEIMHTKEALVDLGLPTGMVIEGSLNFSPTGFRQDNTLLFIWSPELAADAATRYETEWAWAKTQEPSHQLAA